MKKFLTLVLLLTLSFRGHAQTESTAELSATTEPPKIEAPASPSIVQATLTDSNETNDELVVVQEAAPTQADLQVIAEPQPVAEEVVVTKVPHNENDVRCLQQNIYYEARGQGKRGMQAVAEVTVNRSKNPNYPKSVCGVVQQRYKGICQFSWVCHPQRHAPRDLGAWEQAGQIAEAVLDGTIGRVVGNATHFHNTHVRPSWTRQFVRIVQIGQHVFYGPKR